jgi:hypothetical protein
MGLMVPHGGMAPRFNLELNHQRRQEEQAIGSRRALSTAFIELERKARKKHPRDQETSLDSPVRIGKPAAS